MSQARVRTLPPDFWSAELRQYFDLWVLDMRQGMRPYTPRSAQNFERRFILYTRKGWEDKADQLTLQQAFQLTNVYSVLSQYPVESYSNRHNMLYSLVSFAKLLISLGVLEEPVLNQLRRLRPKRVIPPRKTVLREEEDIQRLRKAIQQKRYESELTETHSRCRSKLEFQDIITIERVHSKIQLKIRRRNKKAVYKSCLKPV